MKTPLYSIVIPAYNEEVLLSKTLASVREAMKAISDEGELIVVDNDSDDRTPEIAIEFGARVVLEKEHKIARVRNAGGDEAKGDYLIFLDADTLLTDALLSKALINLKAGSIVGGGVLLEFDKGKGVFSDLLVYLWSRLSVIMKWPAGSFVFCLKTAFAECGGFCESVYAGEEVWFGRQLKKWGKMKGLGFEIISDEKIVTSGRKLDWYPTWFLMFWALIFAIFPFVSRFKICCSIWYKRPE